MLTVVLNTPVEECKVFKYGEADARIVGSKIVVENGRECLLVTEFGNVKELVKEE